MNVDCLVFVSPVFGVLRGDQCKGYFSMSDLGDIFRTTHDNRNILLTIGHIFEVFGTEELTNDGHF